MLDGIILRVPSRILRMSSWWSCSTPSLINHCSQQSWPLGLLALPLFCVKLLALCSGSFGSFGATLVHMVRLVNCVFFICVFSIMSAVWFHITLCAMWDCAGVVIVRCSKQFFFLEFPFDAPPAYWGHMESGVFWASRQRPEKEGQKHVPATCGRPDFSAYYSSLTITNHSGTPPATINLY